MALSQEASVGVQNRVDVQSPKQRQEPRVIVLQFLIVAVVRTFPIPLLFGRES
jgi:hypothetical protein